MKVKLEREDFNLGTKLEEKKLPSEVIEKSKPETEKSDKSKKRDVSVDLIRIVACISVILTHLCLQVLNRCYNRIDWSRLLEKSFFTDGVPLFFMITGFFLVNGRSYKKIWKSTFFKILLPSFIFVIFVQIFEPFILNQTSFLECISNINFSFMPIIQAILKADVRYLSSLCDHLWYIFSYVKIVIWIPILWLVCKENDNCKLARRIMIGLTFVSTVLADIQRFWTLPIIGEINIITIIPKEIMYVLLGYELFIHKDKIKNNRKICIISLIGFVVVNLIRYRTEMFYMVLNYFTDIVGRPSFMEWRYTSLNVFSGLFLFMFLYSFEIRNEILSKILVWVSDKTFGIYLIHYLILAKIDLYKFEKIEKFIFEILYLIIGTIITATISIIIVTLIKKLQKIFKKLLSHIGEKNEKNNI